MSQAATLLPVQAQRTPSDAPAGAVTVGMDADRGGGLGAMATTEQLGLRVEEWAKATAHDGALEAVTSATGTGVVAAPSSEEAREMILWLIGRLRWERQLDSLQRRSPTSGARACS